MNTQNNVPKKHGIQLVSIQTIEMSIKVNSLEEAKMLETGDFSLEVARSEYNKEAKTINVMATLFIQETSETGKTNPFYLKVSIIGEFEVDEDNFPKKHVEDWAEKASMFVLYPYIREVTYTLTSRCGIDAVILPLFEVPTYKVAQT